VRAVQQHGKQEQGHHVHLVQNRQQGKQPKNQENLGIEILIKGAKL
jgi:hypothetical protein